MKRDLTNTIMSPHSVIIIYADRSNDYYLEQRAIKRNGDKYELMQAVPMANDVLKDIARSYAKSNTISMNMGGEVAEHLLYCDNKIGETVIVWHRPAMKRMLNLHTAMNLKESKEAWIPATLYVLRNNSLSMFALADNSRPTSKTKLYNAPFFNTGIGGGVCLGTAKVGDKQMATYAQEAERYERGFFMADQTHESGAMTKTALKKVWAQQIATGKPFPKSELVQNKTYKTFGDLISKIVNGK